MRIIILLLTLSSVLFFFGCGISLDNLYLTPKERIMYTELKFKDVKAEAMYETAHIWIDNFFSKYQGRLVSEDKEKGILITEGKTVVSYEEAFIPARYTMIIEITDGNCNVTFKDYIVSWPDGERELIHKAGVEEIKENLKIIVSTLISYIKARHR